LTDNNNGGDDMNDSYNANLLLGLPLLWAQIGAGDYFASLAAEIQQAVN